MSARSELRTWLTAYRIHARRSGTQLPSLVAIVIGSLIVTPGLFSLYAALFRGNPNPASGLTLSAAIWSLAMYSLYWGVGTRNIPRDIEREIKSGEVELRLVKPTSYLPSLFAQRLGYQRALIFLQGGAVMFCAWLFVGFPQVDVSLSWIAFSAALLVFGLALSLSLFTLIGLAAFWFENTRSFLWIVDKSTMLLGGGLVPIALFPPTLRLFAEYSPFGAALSFAQMWNPDFLERAPHLFMAQVVWLCITFTAVVLVFGQAKRRLSVNGG